MKIYQTETQEDYDALMVELGEEGCQWFSGNKPLEGRNRWSGYEEEFCVLIENKKMSYSERKWCEKERPDVSIEKYKAKQTMLDDTYLELVEETQELKNDLVNNPAHYTQGELEVIDILQDKLSKEEFEGFLKGNILKYTFRESIKNGTEDVKKAAWYTARLIKFRGVSDEAAKRV